jgi:hypothetical protein
MGKEKIIPIFAMVLLLIGTFSTLYVHALSQTSVVEEGDILINGETYSIEGEKTGIALDELITDSYDGCYNCNNYLIEGEDGYKKTVDWSMMQKGILTEESRVFFPETAHAFWVRDVVKIEVK